MAGIAGLVVLAWAAGRFGRRRLIVYPVELLLAAFASGRPGRRGGRHGVISALTSWQPLRWVGVRSYGIYLWHWPVIALGTALVGPAASSPWLWLAETGVTIALASASWRFLETPTCGTACAPPSATGCSSWPRPVADRRRARAAAPFRSRWPRPRRSPSCWPATA